MVLGVSGSTVQWRINRTNSRVSTDHDDSDSSPEPLPPPPRIISLCLPAHPLRVLYPYLVVGIGGGGGGGGDRGVILPQVRPTNFRASTDGVAMLKIAAHPNGRVFMAGKDGNLYELTYSVAYGFWYSVFFVGSPGGTRRCDRLTHKSTSGGPGAVNSVLALFGLRRAAAERVLVDVVVDPLRNVLYTLDRAGDIDLFDLGADGNSTTQKARASTPKVFFFFLFFFFCMFWCAWEFSW